MRIFISGGTGFVGGHVVRELLGRGHEARLLVHRRGPGMAGTEQVLGDVTRIESFGDALEGCGAAVNLVGIIREYPARGITFERLHVQATANVLAAAQAAGVRRFIQMSALGARFDASGYHVSKYRAEELVRDSGLEWTILRPSLIFGPGDSFISMLAGQLRHSPIVPVIGDGGYRLQPIHAEDVARCFALSLERPETIRRTFELCGNEPIRFTDLLDMIADALGRRKPLKARLPLWLMKLLVPVLERFPAFPITSDQLRMLLEESVCDCGWKTFFGFEPRNLRDEIGRYLKA